MAVYHDEEHGHQSDSTFHVKVVLLTLLGLGCALGLILSFHFLTGTIR